MKKKIFQKASIILLLVVINLTGCASNKTLEGKWVSLYDNESYLEFNTNKTFINSLWIDNRTQKLLDYFTYKLSDSGLITAIDTTEYEGLDELITHEIGYLYKDYICIAWDGVLPETEKDETVVSTPLGDSIVLKYSFNSDGTYNYEASVDGIVQEDFNETGTYSVDKNVIICTNNTGTVTTFFNTENGVLCAEYVRE